MKNRLIFIGIVGLALMLSLVIIPAQEASADGACTPEDEAEGWICISDRNDLEQVSNDLTGKYKLANDIDLSPVLNWTPIGDYSADQPFTGKLDGNGYVISGMNISGTDSYRGLFGYTQWAEISNVRLIDVNIDVSGSASYVGGLIGISDEGTDIANTLVTGSITGVRSGTPGSKYVGGLIGQATGTEIKNSSFSGAVEGKELVGGIVGELQSGSRVEHSYAAADVIGTMYVGGVVGRTYGNVFLSSFSGIVDGIDVVGGIAGALSGSIEQSYVTGDLTGKSFIGGLVGFIVSDSTINESYAAVSLTLIPSYMYVGGLVGEAPPESIQNDINRSYWDMSFYETSEGGVGLDTADMKKISSFSDWDFSTDWGLIENTTYPMHRAGYEQVLLDSILVDGDPLAGFTSGHGTYTIFRGSDDPIKLTPILAATASESTVTINGNNDLTAPVHLPSDPTKIEIQVESANGVWTGLYILHIHLDEQDPDIELTLDPSSLTADDVKVDVEVDGTGSNIQLVKWAAGDQNKAYFELSGTTLDGPDYSFTVGSNGVYTVYARDEAGNETVETVTISYIVEERPIISLTYDSTPTNGSVDLSVTTVVYGQDVGNAIAELQWAPGSLVAGDFAGSAGEDVTGGQFTVTENGPYTVYALDGTGFETVETVDVNWIIKQSPIIEHDYNSTAARSSSIEITVTTAVYGTEVGNELAILKWANGSYAASDFTGDTLGENITAERKFTVVSNGVYTLYAMDIAGNETAVTVTVNRIASMSSSSSVPACPTDICIQLAAGEAISYEAEGLTLTIPANATNESMNIMLQNITSQFGEEERLIGQVYEITKSVAGRFLKPVTLEFRFDPNMLGDHVRPAVFYYDEEEQLWIELGGTKLTSENTVQGETDHFTKFAVLSVQNEPILEELEVSFSDIDGHWAESSIVRATRIGFVSGYADGSFQPDRAVSRAEFTVMLASAVQLKGDDALTFTDHSSIPSWSRQAVAAAVVSGILSGYDDGTFRPQGLINRSEMAVMAAKAAGLTPLGGAETVFADNAAIPVWSKPYVAAAYDAGLISGRGGNRFASVDMLTRAEAVVILLRVIDTSNQ